MIKKINKQIEIDNSYLYIHFKEKDCNLTVFLPDGLDNPFKISKTTGNLWYGEEEQEVVIPDVWSYYTGVKVENNNNSLTFTYIKTNPANKNKEGSIVIRLNGTILPIQNTQVVDITADTSVHIEYTSDSEGTSTTYTNTFTYVEPKFYEEVDYIASAHYQKKGFINTNWIPNITDKCYIEGELFGGLSTRNVCGVYVYYKLTWTYTSGTDYVKVQAQSSNTPTTTPLEIAVNRSGTTLKTPIHLSAVISKPTSTVNGVETQTGVTRTSNYSYPFFIFNASNSKDTETGLWRVYSSNACATFHMESIKVKNANDELIHDWVPVRLLRDLVEGEYNEMTLSGTKQGDYGLVDKVTGIYYSCWIESDEQLIIGGNY